jgi:cell fate (sporulation/competence/biofilm development) regulator YlbF (YheA/YmcA/DUF963 family)
MPLTDEMKQVAGDLGKQLGADSNVREYVRLVEQARQDVDVAALEIRYNQMYQSLLERQQNGETLVRSEIDEFYRLKRELQDNPLLTDRDNQLVLVQALFAQTAQRLSDALGIEYSTFAK